MRTLLLLAAASLGIIACTKNTSTQATGAQQAPSVAAPPSSTGFEIVRVRHGDTGDEFYPVHCPAGMRAVNGGTVSRSGGTAILEIPAEANATHLSADRTTLHVTGVNAGEAGRFREVWAACVAVSRDGQGSQSTPTP